MKEGSLLRGLQPYARTSKRVTTGEFKSEAVDFVGSIGDHEARAVSAEQQRRRAADRQLAFLPSNGTDV